MHTFVHNYLIQQSVHMTWSNFFHLSILTSLHARERFLRSCQMQANSGKTVDSRIPLEFHLAVVTYAKDIHFILLRLKNMVSLEGVVRCINTSQHESNISLISSLDVSAAVWPLFSPSLSSLLLPRGSCSLPVRPLLQPPLSSCQVPPSFYPFSHLSHSPA